MKYAALLALAGSLYVAHPAVGSEEAAESPPIVHYGGSRRSSKWVTLPTGTRVAVDKGVTWKGVTVYLSLTWQLVGVDAKTDKTLFGAHVSAYWNSVTFKEVTPKGGTKQWAIELRPGPHSRADAPMRQYHDLRTGKRLEVPGLVDTPSGEKLTPRLHYHGGKSDIAEKFAVLISSPESWATFQARMFSQDDRPTFEAIDFDKEVVLALSSGNSSNCRGITFAEGFEDADRILVRVDRSTFQTMNGYEKTRPWGLFVLPRRPEKTVEVERNAQGLIGGPPLWRQIHTFEGIGPSEKELGSLPAKNQTPHQGWSENIPRRLPPPKKPK